MFIFIVLFILYASYGNVHIGVYQEQKSEQVKTKYILLNKSMVQNTRILQENKNTNHTHPSLIGHIHIAKTAGTTLNGNLSLLFQHICGHKGYSYDSLQRNIRYTQKKGDSISKHDPSFSRSRVPPTLMEEIGFEDCDWISHEVEWTFWRRFISWNVSMHLHVPCRDAVDHLMSQCNHFNIEFNCFNDFKVEVKKCITAMDRFSLQLLNLHKNIHVKCFDYTTIFTDEYYSFMRKYLQPKKWTAKYSGYKTNKERNVKNECVWKDIKLQKKIKDYLFDQYDYYKFCNECLGTKNDLFYKTKS